MQFGKYLNILLILAIPVLMFSCGNKPLKSESLLDTPQTHVDQGVRLMDRGELDSAEKEFTRALAMDSKFYMAKGNMALLRTKQNRNKAALNLADEALNMSDKNWRAYYIKGRVLSAAQPDDWYKDALKIFEKGLKAGGNEEEYYFWLASARMAKLKFAKAVNDFAKVVGYRGEYSGRADKNMELCNKIIRANPGTKVSSKIALQPNIDRADMAVLLVEELQLPSIMKKMKPQVRNNKFAAPTNPAKMGATDVSSVQKQSAIDIQDHWARTWIEDILNSGTMGLHPGSKFNPEETMTRGEFAMTIVDILVEVSRDPGLASRHFGEKSMFPDVSSSHPQYNAIAVCSSRGLMQANFTTGEFGLLKSISGADALLTIRKFQAVLRQTF
jgi:tetratricopeptide (TPR) repeat protein